MGSSASFSWVHSGCRFVPPYDRHPVAPWQPYFFLRVAFLAAFFFGAFLAALAAFLVAFFLATSSPPNKRAGRLLADSRAGADARRFRRPKYTTENKTNYPAA